MLIHQIGNFIPDHSTENELEKALASLGHEVREFQENFAGIFNTVCNNETPDMILWTRTRWNPDTPRQEAEAMISRARERNVPVIGYHLDRWWGLNREPELNDEPFFKVDTLYTADGGDHDWESKGINHKWLPPAVDLAQCYNGIPRDEYKSEIAFIGSWDGGYHKEHQHRFDLIHWLQTNYGDRVKLWPQEGQPSVRGRNLNDLIASCDVIIGDSCFTGTSHYISDRVPETLGRGGFLIHPRIIGATDGTLFTDGKHLATWEPFVWNVLKDKIDHYLANPEERKQIAEQGQSWVKRAHTYNNRMQKVLEDEVVFKSVKDYA